MSTPCTASAAALLSSRSTAAESEYGQGLGHGYGQGRVKPDFQDGVRVVADGVVADIVAGIPGCPSQLLGVRASLLTFSPSYLYPGMSSTNWAVASAPAPFTCPAPNSSYGVNLVTRQQGGLGVTPEGAVVDAAGFTPTGIYLTQIGAPRCLSDDSAY